MLDIHKPEEMEKVTVILEGVHLFLHSPANGKVVVAPNTAMAIDLEVAEAPKFIPYPCSLCLLISQFLYIEKIVWPDDRLRATKLSGKSSQYFTLQTGSYTFPFRLQIPLYTFCGNSRNEIGLKHIKQILPPSFRDDNADVAYFVFKRYP